MIRAVARFCIAVLIGVGATLAWQTHGDQASEIIKTWAASLGQRLAGSTTKSAAEITLPAAQTAIPVQAAAQDGAPAQSRPGPQNPSASAGQAAPAAASTQQLDAIARNLAMVQKGVEQLSAKQEEMARNIATLQAAEHQSKVVPLPPRKKIVAGAPQRASPSSVDPPPSSHPTPVARPPISLDPTR